MRRLFIVCAIAALAGLAWQSAAASELTLHHQSSDQAATELALTRAAESQLKNPAVFASRLYRLSEDGRNLGTLVNGWGHFVNSAGLERSACFLFLAGPEAKDGPALTVGTGDWETESCLGVKDFAIIARPPSVAGNWLGILYRASSPNFETVEPVVLSWDEQERRFVIDAAASKRASLAGTTTIKGIEGALAR